MTEVVNSELLMVEEQSDSIWPGKTTRTHIWLKVLEGPDEGIKLSIPLYSDFYTSELENEIQRLSQGNVIRASLQRENKQDTWKITEIHEKSKYKPL